MLRDRMQCLFSLLLFSLLSATVCMDSEFRLHRSHWQWRVAQLPVWWRSFLLLHVGVLGATAVLSNADSEACLAAWATAATRFSYQGASCLDYDLENALEVCFMLFLKF